MTANIGQRGATTTASETGLTSAMSPADRRTRAAYRVLAAGFILGLMFQFFIVGMALFVDGGRWDLHRPVGHALGLFPLAMLALSFAARMSWTTRLLTALTFVLVIMQQVTVSIGEWVAAVHPVNAVLLVGLGLLLFTRTADGPDSPGIQGQGKGTDT